MLVLPLGITVAGLAGQWWAVLPLAIAIWFCAPQDPSWAWIVGVQSGVVGVEWAYSGAFAFGEFPQWFWLVALGWFAFPLALCIAGISARRWS